jgi:hypothetical protein
LRPVAITLPVPRNLASCTGSLPAEPVAPFTTAASSGCGFARSNKAVQVESKREPLKIGLEY